MPAERRLAHLVEVQAALSRALARLDAKGDAGRPRVAPLPAGYTALGTPREELRDPPEATALAFARALFFWSYLRRKPTALSVLRTTRRMRAYAVWRSAVARHHAHQPLPLAVHYQTLHGQRVPPFALHAPLPAGSTAAAKPTPAAKTHTRTLARASTPDDPSGPDGLLSSDEMQAVWDALLNDPEQFAWYWEQGANTSVPVPETFNEAEAGAFFAELDADPLAFLLRYGGSTPDEVLRALSQYLGLDDLQALSQRLLGIADRMGEDAALSEDALAFWATAGAPYDLTPEEWASGLQAPTPDQSEGQQPGAASAPPSLSNLSMALPAELTADAALLAFESNLASAERLFSDTQLLQLINTYWAGQQVQLGAAGFMGDLGAEAGIISSWNIVNPAALDYLRQQSGALITGIDETTRQMVAETLWEAYRGIDYQALPIDQLARYLQASMQETLNDLNGMSRYRALLIARTETARALSFGEMVVAAKWGLRWKRWIANAGACLLCLGNVDAGIIPLQESFPSGHLAPPLHPMCKCACSSVLANGDDAFDPENWADPATTDQWDGMLFDPAYGTFPNVQWPMTPDLADAPPPATPDDLGLLDYDSLPPDLQEMLTPDLLNQMGQMLAGRAETGTSAWAKQQGVDVPTSDADLAGLDLSGLDPAELDALWGDLGSAADDEMDL